VADGAGAGYWPSPWPGEDGGPTRSQAPHGVASLGLRAGETLVAHRREVLSPTMVVLREAGEVFVLAHTIGPDSVSWVERVDPRTLAPLDRSPELPGGPFWPGGVAAHANGALYVVYGRWCHRLAPDCTVEVGRALPRERPYNSFVILDDGHLVTKDFPLDPTGAVAGPSQLVVLEPEGLEIVATRDLPEGSIARLSADGGVVYVVGEAHGFRLAWDGRRLALDDAWTFAYRTEEGQTFGWDPVLEAGAAWFLDDGAGTQAFGGSFRGRGVSTAPLRLWRRPLDGSPATSVAVCGAPGGIIANPPAVDPERRIAVGFDSGNAVLAAWTFDDDGFEPRWRRDQDHAAHMIRFPDSGELVCFDHSTTEGEHAVVLDLETGEELGRVAIDSPVQSVLFPAPGWDRDFYAVTFTGVSRVSVEPA
jgi:hypothetical protein